MRRAALFLLTALAALAAFAEDAALPRLRVSTSVEVSGADAESWAASLDAALIRSPFVAAVRRASGGDDPIEAAAVAAYDIAFVARAEIDVEKGVVRLERTIFDTRSAERLWSDVSEFPTPGDFDLSQTFWIPSVAAVESVADRFAPPPPAKKTRAVLLPAEWNMEWGLYMGQFPDWRVGRGFLSNRIFLRFCVYQFLFGSYFGDDSFGAVSYPVIQPGLSLDAFFLGDATPVRPYLSFTAFLRFCGDGFDLDTIAPFGTTAMVGARWRVTSRLSAFFELGMAYYPGCDGYLLAVEAGGGEGGYPFVYGDDYLVQFSQFRFGVRLKI